MKKTADVLLVFFLLFAYSSLQAATPPQKTSQEKYPESDASYPFDAPPEQPDKTFGLSFP